MMTAIVEAHITICWPDCQPLAGSNGVTLDARMVPDDLGLWHLATSMYMQNIVIMKACH